MAVHDQQSSSARVIGQRSRLKDGGQPFAYMAIAGPTTLASRETPVWGRARRYPCCVGILDFEDEQGRDSRARCTHALNGCYPLLAGPHNLPTGFLPDIDERSRRLARSNGELRSVHVVNVLRLVLVLYAKLRHCIKPRLHHI